MHFFFLHSFKVLFLITSNTNVDHLLCNESSGFRQTESPGVINVVEFLLINMQHVCTFKVSVGSSVPPSCLAMSWRGGDLPILAMYRPQRPSPPTASSPWECCWRLTCLLSPGGGWHSLCHDHTLQSERNLSMWCVWVCVTWNTSTLSSSGGVINLLSILIWGCCRKVTTIRSPLTLTVCWDVTKMKGEKIPCRRERRREVKTGRYDETMRATRVWAKLRQALKWSHTFCMIIAVKFLILSQQAQKTKAAWD